MSNLSWQQKLQETLSKPKRSKPPRIAVVGIGNELRGDDIAGTLIADMLQPVAHNCDRLLVINAGLAPENFTGPLRRFAPHFVLLVDAAQMDEPPGTIRLLSWQDTVGISASTHTLPPYVLASYLHNEIGCQVALLGIQPAHTVLGGAVSAQVQQAIDIVVRDLPQLL